MEIKNREKALLVAVGIGLLLLLGDNFVVTPLIKSWKSRADHIAELKKSIDNGQLLIQRQDTITTRWDHMRDNTLTNNVSLAETELFKTFDLWRQNSGASLVSVKPEWKQTDDNYTAVECRVDVSGDMATVLRFLYDMEQTPMALKLDSIELAAHDDNGQQISLGLQVSGLVLNDAEDASNSTQ